MNTRVMKRKAPYFVPNGWDSAGTVSDDQRQRCWEGSAALTISSSISWAKHRVNVGDNSRAEYFHLYLLNGRHCPAVAVAVSKRQRPVTSSVRSLPIPPSLANSSRSFLQLPSIL